LIAYLDASAIVKVLLSGEDGSGTAAELWDAADLVVTSRVSYPEGRAALAAARRARRVTGSAADRARLALDSMFDDLDVVELDDGLAASAGDVADRFGLRANDAIHLASALALEDPRVVVVTWDRELAAAARRAELAVAP